MDLLARYLAENITGRTVERSSQKVNRDRKHPERIQIPKLVLQTGAGMFSFEIFVVASSILIEQDRPVTGIVIGLLFALLLGMSSLFVYKNSWYSIDPESISFRLVFNGEKRIRFVDIVSREVIQRQKDGVLRIWDSHGTRFQISVPLFDILLILTRSNFYDQFQH